MLWCDRVGESASSAGKNIYRSAKPGFRPIGLIHFSGVTNKIHHCLRFPCGSRHLVRAVVPQTHVLVLVSHTSLVSHINITLVCETNALTTWRLPLGKRKQ